MGSNNAHLDARNKGQHTAQRNIQIQESPTEPVQCQIRTSSDLRDRVHHKQFGIIACKTKPGGVGVGAIAFTLGLRVGAGRVVGDFH